MASTATTTSSVQIVNLTDVETPSLKQRGLSSRGLQVGDVLIEPGSTATFDAATWKGLKPRYKRLFEVGALAEGDKIPPTYTTAKNKKAEKKADPKKTPTPPSATTTPSTPPSATTTTTSSSK